MGRIIGSAIVGYLVIFPSVFLLMTLAWVALGPAGAFKPGVWDVTPLWIALMLLAGFVAAFAGGWVASKVAGDARGPKLLAAIVFVLGIVFALPVLTGSMPVAELPRPDQMPMFDAMNKGRQPAWVALLNPVIGAVGVLLGARRSAAPEA